MSGSTTHGFYQSFVLTSENDFSKALEVKNQHLIMVSVTHLYAVGSYNQCNVRSIPHLGAADVNKNLKFSKDHLQNVVLAGSA